MQTTTAGEARAGLSYMTPLDKRVLVIGPAEDSPGFITVENERGRQYQVPDQYQLTLIEQADDSVVLQALIDDGRAALTEAIPGLTDSQLDTLATMDIRMWAAAAILGEQRSRMAGSTPTATASTATESDTATCPLCDTGCRTRPSNVPGQGGQPVMAAHKADEGVLCAGSGRTVEAAQAMVEATASTTATTELEEYASQPAFVRGEDDDAQLRERIKKADGDPLKDGPTPRQKLQALHAILDAAEINQGLLVQVQRPGDGDDWVDDDQVPMRIVKVVKRHIHAEWFSGGSAVVQRFSRKSGRATGLGDKPIRLTIVDTCEAPTAPGLEPVESVYGPVLGFGRDAPPAKETLDRVRRCGVDEIPRLVEALELRTDDRRYRQEVYNVALLRIMQLDHEALTETMVIEYLMGLDILSLQMAWSFDRRSTVQEAITEALTSYGFRLGAEDTWLKRDESELPPSPDAEQLEARLRDPYAAGVADGQGPYAPDEAMPPAARKRYGDGWWAESHLDLGLPVVADADDIVQAIFPLGLVWDGDHIDDEQSAAVLDYAKAMADHWTTADHQLGTHSFDAPASPPEALRWWLDPFGGAIGSSPRGQAVKAMDRAQTMAVHAVAAWSAEHPEQIGYIEPGPGRFWAAMKPIGSTVARDISRHHDAFTTLDPLYVRGRAGDLAVRDEFVHLLSMQRIQRRPAVHAEITAFLLDVFEWAPVVAEVLVADIEATGDATDPPADLVEYLASLGMTDTMEVLAVHAMISPDPKARRHTIERVDDVLQLRAAWAWSVICCQEEPALELDRRIRKLGGEPMLWEQDTAWAGRMGSQALATATTREIPWYGDKGLADLCRGWSIGWLDTEDSMRRSGSDGYSDGADLRDCPHDGPWAHVVWREGWIEARASKHIDQEQAATEQDATTPSVAMFGTLGMLLANLKAAGLSATITISTKDDSE